MDREVRFDVDAHSAPVLQGDDQPEPSSTAAPAVDPSALPPPLPMGWTPEEAASLLAGAFNLGILFYGPDWASDPREFGGSGALAVPYLDRYVPKGVGGAMGLGSLGLVAFSETVDAVRRRAAIIAAGPKPLWGPRPAASTTDRSVAPPPARPAPPVEPSASADPLGGGKYVLHPDMAAFAEATALQRAYEGQGYIEAAA